MKLKKDNKYPNSCLENPFNTNEDINMNQDHLLLNTVDKMGYNTENAMMHQAMNPGDDNVARPMSQFMNMPGPPCIS